MEGDNEEMLMKGKTAIITGSARGLGKAAAMKLASLGANIVLNDIPSSESLDNTAEEFRRQTSISSWQKEMSGIRKMLNP
jgi:NAD(P)-dependent dehydrogenase (short-subunit alcohol dehydrogenase family)